MRLLVNAISVKEGGALVVLRKLIEGIRERRPEWVIHAACSPEAALILRDISGVEFHTFPKVSSSYWRTRLWYETGLIRLVKDINANILFSQTNYLPFRKPRCFQLLLEQHAGHFSPLFDHLMCKSLNVWGRRAWRMKNHWVRKSILAADMVTVQTAALANAIVSTTGVSRNKIVVIPHGVGQSHVDTASLARSDATKLFIIGYTTRFGVQKNFDVLFRAVAELKRRGLKVRLDVTLNPLLPDNQDLLLRARNLGIEDVLNNMGDLDVSVLRNAYSGFHVFAFPSLCESFGFPLVEAMASLLPVVVSDTESNREVAGEAGIYFPASDFLELANQLQKLATEPRWYSERVAASQKRQADFSWTLAAEQTAVLIENTVLARPKSETVLE